MPRKAKFSAEQIAKEGLSLVRQEGMAALSARRLSKRLSCSVVPIFSVFHSMEELSDHIIQLARNHYRTYIEQGLAQPIPFKGVGIQYIRFAQEEGKLFQLLFMQEKEQPPVLDHILALIDDSYDAILRSVQSTYDLSEQDSKDLYLHLWIYTHGIAVLCATHSCVFTPDQIQTMLSEVCISLLTTFKGGKHNDYTS